MRLRLLLAAAAILLAFASAAGAPPPAGANTTPPPTRIAYFPLIVYQPTPTPTATPTLPPTATPTRTSTPAAACMGDEEISFVPDPGGTGSAVTVNATSARPSVNVNLQVLYGGVAQAVAWQGVEPGGKGYVWSWSFTPAQPGQYTARFYVEVNALCVGRVLQVNGEAIPTATPTTSPVPSATPTPTATRVTSDDCGGDEEISFVPDPGATGSSLAVSVTSAQPSANVVLQVLFQGASQAVGVAKRRPRRKGLHLDLDRHPLPAGVVRSRFLCGKHVVLRRRLCAGAGNSRGYADGHPHGHSHCHALGGDAHADPDAHPHAHSGASAGSGVGLAADLPEHSDHADGRLAAVERGEGRLPEPH